MEKSYRIGFKNGYELGELGLSCNPYCNKSEIDDYIQYKRGYERGLTKFRNEVDVGLHADEFHPDFIENIKKRNKNRNE